MLVLLALPSASAFAAPGRSRIAPRVPAVACTSRMPAVVACAPPPAVAEIEDDDRPIDPKEAVKEIGALADQIKVLWTEGKTWDAETRTVKRREIVKQYVRVFAPAMAFSGCQLSVTFAAFFLYLVVLGASGLGFDAVQEAGAGVPLLGDLLAKVDPSWGNAAIALVLVEVSAPLLIPAAALLTPKATESFEAKLKEWGFDAEGLNAKLEKNLPMA